MYVVTPSDVQNELIAKGANVGLFYAKFFPRPRKEAVSECDDSGFHGSMLTIK